MKVIPGLPEISIRCSGGGGDGNCERGEGARGSDMKRRRLPARPQKAARGGIGGGAGAVRGGGNGGRGMGEAKNGGGRPPRPARTTCGSCGACGRDGACGGVCTGGGGLGEMRDRSPSGSETVASGTGGGRGCGDGGGRGRRGGGCRRVGGGVGAMPARSPDQAACCSGSWHGWGRGRGVGGMGGEQ